ncbi:uncharacterized protein LOC115401202 [Salarias fasciatus]|uniref:Uncharacterized LOC115401202 n=1 Tax=Salarias fasciatus TaxID=181472 RepID=A0A672HE79_SALFA|nr:uncharacterized protein LOC115401202 [Salarias fasciatus]
MHFKILIFTLSFLTTSAYPLHSDTKEISWMDSKGNDADDKTDPTKDIEKVYKSKIDSDGLYIQESDDKNPLTEEMQRKLTMESERLRVRLRQELAELRERLSPSADHPSYTLASMRERLTPLTQQLQSSVSSNTQDLCSQLSLYLQGLETAEAQAEATPALYEETFQLLGRTLEHSSTKLAGLINDFHTKANGVIDYLREISSPDQESAKLKVCEETGSRLGQEVGLLREEGQSRVRALKAQLAALLHSSQPPRAELRGSVEQFCQNASLQSEALQARLESLLMGLSDGADGQTESSLLHSYSSSAQQSGSLQEDFSVKLSALIQDIFHSVQ